VRVVLDSNILVRANPLVSPHGLARDLLLTIIGGPHVLVLSPAILIEVRRVLSYPNVRERWPLGDDSIDRYLAFLETAGALVELPQSFPAIVSDPDDDPIIQTAITGQADVLCTRDQAFQHEAVHRVCVAHKIRILDDVILMRELRHVAKG
jgi:uncharacterized protein